MAQRTALAIMIALSLFLSSSSFAQLAKTPWPMRGHDLQHTGRSPYKGPDKPKLKWRYQTGVGSFSSPALGSDGTVYVGSDDGSTDPVTGQELPFGSGSVYAVNANGTLKWRYQAGGNVDSSPAVGGDGTVYVGSSDGYVYALTAAGKLKWRYQTEGSIKQTGGGVISSPAIGSDGTVYVGSLDGYVYALTAAGKLKWRYQTEAGDWIVSSPALGGDGTVYVGSIYGYVYALTATGVLKWRYETESDSNMDSDAFRSSPALGSDGTVYLGSEFGYVYALTSTGSLRWRFETDRSGDDYEVNSSPALGSDGTVYVGSNDGYVYALTATGSLKWRYQTGNYVESSPALGSDGMVYVGSNDGYIYALTATGRLKWRYQTEATEDDGGVGSSPVLGSDGTLYVGAGGDGYLYAVENRPTNAAPVLSGGKVAPGNGDSETEFAFSVTYTDADNDEPAAITAKLDNGTPVAMTKRQSDDNNYADGAVYEYKTKLSAGTHTFTFAASDGAANATGDVAAHTGLQVTAYKAPVLANTPWPMWGHDLQHTGRSPYKGPDKPRLKWSYTTGNQVYSSPALGSDGTVYVGSGDGYVYALSSTGSLKWRNQTGSGVFSSPALGSDGTVYVGSYDGYVYALSSTGSLKWHYQTGDGVESSPALGSDGTIYVGSDDGYVYALSSTGSLKWRYQTGRDIESSPALGSDGTVYVGSDDGYVYALSSTGSLKWRYIAESGVSSSPALGSDGTIFVGSWDGYVYALSSTGSLKWRYQTGGGIYSSPALGNDGTVFVGSADRYVYALSSIGNLKWRYQTEGRVVSSAALGSDGTVYVGSRDGYVYALSSTGSLKWRYRTGQGGSFSPALGSDGTVYVGSNNGAVYAVENRPTNAAPVLSNGNVEFEKKYYYEVVTIEGKSDTVAIDKETYDDLVYRWKVWNAWTALLIPHVSNSDDDGDGQIDEDPIDFIDNDGDGRTDEDGTKLGKGKMPTSEPVETVSLPEFVFSVTYTDADDDEPAAITVKIDNGVPVTMTKRRYSIDDYELYGVVYEYSTKLVAGTHSYTFAASDFWASATGDIAAHTGLQVKANTAPVLSGGKLEPATGNTQTDFVFSVTYTDADNTAPSKITVKLDNGTPMAMTKRQSSDNNYADGAVYEYKTKLTAGTHTFTFAASDGSANATGDVSAHTGLQIKANTNTVPVLSAGAVSPTTGNTQTDFVFSVTYTDADNTAPSKITVKLDSSTPVAMTKRQSSDNNYVDGTVYEYKAKLSAGTHSYTFAASDGSASATGDIGSHSVPRVETATATPSIPAWAMWGRDAQHTRRSAFKGPDRPRLKWSFGYDQVGISSSPAVGADGTVYMGFLNGVFMAMDSSAAHLVWYFETGEAIYSAPAIGGDGTIYVGSDDDYLYALTSVGKLKWRYQTEGDVSSSPVIGSDGTIYVGSNDGYLYALNPAGTLKWRYQTGSGVFSSPALGSDGTIYVGSWDNYVYALNPTGTLKWRYQTGDDVASSPALGSDGTIYVGSGDGYVYALNSTGGLKWRYQTGAAVDSSPALGSDGTVYVGSEDTYVYALSSTGSLKWRYQTGAGVYSSPALGGDGTLYVGSEDGYVYAIGNSPVGKVVAQVVPQVFGLEQNYPNPFNPETVIRYQLPEAGQVRLEIYNMLGQKVRTLVDEVQSAGSYKVRWDGRDGAGKEVSSGVYFYHLVGGNNQLFRKMLLVR